MPDRDNIFVKEVKIEPFLLEITTLNFKVLTAVVCLCIFFHSALWFAFIFSFSLLEKSICMHIKVMHKYVVKKRSVNEEQKRDFMSFVLF